MMFHDGALPPVPDVPIVWGAAGEVASRLLVGEVVKACAKHIGEPVAEVISYRRDIAINRPRQAAMYVATRHCHFASLPHIGMKFGGRDPTTIKHARKRVQADLDAGGEIFGPLVEGIEKQLGLR